MKATPEELELHERLMAGDPIASAVVADKFLTPLIKAMQLSFPHVDEHLLSSFAADAILMYAANPQRYNPGKLDLFGYLKMDAKGDLKNELQRQKRIVFTENIQEVVELQQTRRNKAESPAGADQILVDRELYEKLNGLIHDPIEKEVLMLMMDNERRTDEFAEAMGIQHLDIEVQRAKVKRMKDKLKIRIRRAGRDSFL